MFDWSSSVVGIADMLPRYPQFAVILGGIWWHAAAQCLARESIGRPVRTTE
jgi:hypothetical protein